MKGLSGILADAYATWLSPLTNCCAPLSNCLDDRHHHNTREISEKLSSTAIIRDQPVPMPPPFARAMPKQNPVGPRPQPAMSSQGSKRSFASLRQRFSVRKRFRSDSSSSPRRLQISGPTNFRHLHSESFQFPQYTSLQTVGRPLPPRPITRPRPSSFRPLELSIYVPKRELSPILPHFDMLTPPPPARVQPNADDDVFGPSHEPSFSPMSFHLPRKMSPSLSTSTTTPDSTPPTIPPKSRARSHTSSSVERMKERIASAIMEVDKLQREIDLVMERQSIYTSSRPSTAYSMALTAHNVEPMPPPTVPALPPAAPSFAERLNPGAERPQTAPPRPPVHIPHRGMTFADASSTFITPPPSRGRETRPPPPPLPLVLRPPLRKKKSFSNVSSWLFPGTRAAAEQRHNRSISRDSITNIPRPVKGRDGFYQCVHAPQDGRTSLDTVSTVSTWESEERTVPTTWSPGSTPATRAEEHPPLERVATFGKGEGVGPGRTTVGVAF